MRVALGLILGVVLVGCLIGTIYLFATGVLGIEHFFVGIGACFFGFFAGLKVANVVRNK
jgi:Kef-type K+ transport system membrane component KefB